jgi:hypothetical protein
MARAALRKHLFARGGVLRASARGKHRSDGANQYQSKHRTPRVPVGDELQIYKAAKR